MDFDIHQLDDVESEEFDDAFEAYRAALLDQFLSSPEGAALLEKIPDAGFWSGALIEYGYNYLGVSLPRMSKADVEELVTEIFPRKISILSPEDADDAIPELIALWGFLKRAYGLRQAGAIQRLLEQVQPDFTRLMTDPSKFGMAKSFMMMGQAAGFDMATQDSMDAFMHAYNAGLAARMGGLSGILGTEPSGGPKTHPSGDPGAGAPIHTMDISGQDLNSPWDPFPRGRPKKTKDRQKKQKRKAAKAARKRNRKR
jgi:hypothetical protein